VCRVVLCLRVQRFPVRQEMGHGVNVHVIRMAPRLTSLARRYVLGQESTVSSGAVGLFAVAFRRKLNHAKLSRSVLEYNWD
jgi:hypothetical protein